MSKSTERISIKFVIGSPHYDLSHEFNIGAYRLFVIPVVHEIQIEL